MVNVGNGIGTSMGGVPIGISGIAEGAKVGVSIGGTCTGGMGVDVAGTGRSVGISVGGTCTLGEVGVTVTGTDIGVHVSVGGLFIGDVEVHVSTISSVDVNVQFGSDVRGSAVELATDAVGNGREN